MIIVYLAEKKIIKFINLKKMFVQDILYTLKSQN